MSQPNFYIYPSLLDKFQKLLNADEEFESNWNIDPEGGYKRSQEEIEAELEQSLLDMINRVPHDPIEAADKGTAFNALVDWINGTPSPIPVGYGEAVGKDGEQIRYYQMQLNGFTFDFNADLVEGAGNYFRGSIPQYRCKATIGTAYGDVMLYGYIDEICQDVVKDIKTTSMYQLGKFEDAWQKEVYPFCLVESGDMESVTAFEYTIYVWRNRVGMPSDATLYKEVYNYDHEKTRAKLRQMLERFIEWLQDHREKITDKKIFGENNG